jgi:hypothetical protein
MKKMKRISAVLGYFCCMIGNTTEAWSYCSSRTDSDMLKVWYMCSLFLLSECGVKMIAPLDVCTKDKQH